MPPTPKTRSTRQRRNTTVGARRLSTVHDTPTPRLPSGRKWHRQTRAWWKDIWDSPMAPEYDESDRHGLFVLAVIVDEFWKAPTRELAGEIRLQGTRFGLSPIDRRRLEWEINRGEAAAEETHRRRAPRPAEEPAQDPRQLLA